MKNILIIRNASLGDTILCLYSIKLLKNKFPESKIYYLSRTIDLKFFLENLNFIDKFIYQKKGIKGKINLIKLIKKLNIDLAINFQRSCGHSILCKLGKCKKIIGFNFFPNSLICNNTYNDSNFKTFMGERYFELIKDIVKHKFYINEFTTDIKLSQQEKQKINELIPNKKFIVLNFTRGRDWKNNYWQINNYKKLLDMILKKHNGLYIVLWCGINEYDECIKFKKLFEENKRIIIPENFDLIEYAYLFTKAKLLITLDTGPKHLAASMGCPTITLAGPSSPIVWSSGYNSEKHIVIFKNIDCSPCEKHICENEKKNLCMNLITPEEVFAAFAKLYNKVN